MPTKKPNAKTSSAPSKRRVRSRANSAAEVVPESSPNQESNGATITPGVEVEPSLPPITVRMKDHTARRARAAQIVGGEQADAFIVDFLPDFLIDRRSDTGAARIPCGEVTGIGGVREEIQARFVPKLGEGYYRITPRINGKITKGQWIEYVEPSITSVSPASSGEEDFDEWLDSEEPDAVNDLTPRFIKLTIENERLKARLEAQREAPKSNGFGTVAERLFEQVIAEKLNPPNPIKEVLSTFQQSEELRKMFAPKESNPRPIQPEHKPTALEALLTLASEEPATLAAIRSRVLGSEGEESGWLQMLPVIAPFAERAIQSISSIVAAFARPPITTVQGGEQNVPQPQTPTASNEEQSQDEVATLAYKRLIGRVLSAMAMNTEVDVVIAALDGFCNLFPEHAATIGDLMSAPAENVLQLINQSVPDAEPVTAAPHALNWMRTLQATFLDEYEQGESDVDGLDEGQSIGRAEKTQQQPILTKQ